MNKLLIKLMVLAAALQLGLNLSDVTECYSRQCANRLERLSREVLQIDWKPISVWPEEAKRFR